MTALAIAGPVLGLLLARIATDPRIPAPAVVAGHGVVGAVCAALLLAALAQDSLVLLAASMVTFALLCAAAVLRAREGGAHDPGGEPPARDGGPPDPADAGDPPWWPEFEREFADHCRSLRGGRGADDAAP